MRNNIGINKVLYVNSSARLYGADKSLLELISLLDRKRFIPIVLLPEKGPLLDELSKLDVKTIVENFVHVERRYLRPLGVLRFLMRLILSVIRIMFIIKRERAHVVHSNSSACIASAVAATLTRTPHIWHIRELVVTPKIVRFLYRTIIPRLCDKAIAISEVVKANYSSCCRTDNAKYIVLSHGVDIRRFETAQASIRGEYSIPQKDKIVGNVGMLRPQKGQTRFLSVARMVKENYPEVKFVVAGDLFYEQGKVDSYLIDLCTSLGLNGDVFFTGFRDDIQNVYASFDVFVHTSESQEAYGRTILESMASGKPIVAFDNGGPGELVVDALTGYLVPVGDLRGMADRIITLLKDDGLRNRMGREAKRLLKEKFSMAKYSKDLERLYYEILEHEKPDDHQ